MKSTKKKEENGHRRTEGTTLSRQIKEWAKGNDWYRIDTRTNQLRLEQTFEPAIEQIVRELNGHNQRLMSRKIYDLYDLMLAKCRKIDIVCRAGCRTKEEMLELELLRGRAVGIASELSEAIQLIQIAKLKIENAETESGTTEFTDCTDRYNPKSQDLKSQKKNEKRKCHTPRLSSQISDKEKQVWSAIHIQKKTIAQAAFEFKCTTQNVYKHLKNAERKIKFQGSRSANTKQRLPEDERGQVRL